jgi:CDP-6-deoxy-D-xylo-4-hexulose-3-dehydrase
MKKQETYQDYEKIYDGVEENEILSLISQYITKKHSKKSWKAGEDWVQYAGPYFDSTEYVAAVKTLLGEWLVLGAEANKFERKFPKKLGKSYGLLANSGSSANLLMMLAMTSKRYANLPKGTKVITPIAGFPTTINPILQVGFKPVFVDIELDTLNLDLDQVEQACIENPDAKIITFAHVLGNPPNMKRLMEIIEKYKLILLEDCCDALGSTYEGKPLGSFGKMASCSFYPAHHITMGEGGFVAVDDPQLERVIRSFREWGRGCYCVGKQNLLENGACGCRFNNWVPNIPDELFDHKYVYEEIGYNLKPIELQASIGLVQMEKLEEIGVKRRNNYKNLFSAFSKYKQYFHLHEAQQGADVDWFAFPITVKDAAPFKRSDICKFFEANKIQTRPYFAGNVMLQPAYDGLMDPKEIIEKYPVARKVTTDTFFLGTSPVIDKEKTDYIESILDTFISQL